MKPEDDTHVGGRGQGTALDIVVVRYGLIVEDMNAKSLYQKKKSKLSSHHLEGVDVDPFYFQETRVSHKGQSKERGVTRKTPFIWWTHKRKVFPKPMDIPYIPKKRLVNLPRPIIMGTVQIFTCFPLAMDSLPNAAIQAAVTQVLVTQRITYHHQETVFAMIMAIPVHVLLI